MVIEFIPVTDADRDALVTFMTGQSFPFHVASSPSVEAVEQKVAEKAWWSPDCQGYWIDADGDRVGFVALEDLQDPTPLFDLRLAEHARRKGVGTAVLRALTDKVFTEMPEVDRFEGQTRDDNIAMRRVMEKCGWVQEACYRESWPAADGTSRSSIAYAILRRDWASGITTPLNWKMDDEADSASTGQRPGTRHAHLGPDTTERARDGRDKPKPSRRPRFGGYVNFDQAIAFAQAGVLKASRARANQRAYGFFSHLMADEQSEGITNSLWKQPGTFSQESDES